MRQTDKRKNDVRRGDNKKQLMSMEVMSESNIKITEQVRCDNFITHNLVTRISV